MAEHRPTLCAALAAGALLLAVGCGDDGGGGENGASATTDTQTTTSAGAQPAAQGQGPTGEGEAADRPGFQVYFTAGEQFQAVERPALEDGGPEEAVRQLLRGPEPSDSSGAVETTTQIPDGVALDGVEVADGTATVMVSPEFLAGVSADPAARDREQAADVSARVGQVAYTMSQYQGVRSTKVVAGGVPVEIDTAGEASGGVSAPTQAKVARVDYAAPAQGPPQVVKPRGAKLPGTRQVQTLLAKLGYLPKRAIDGLAGYQTQQAVIAFQAWNGLDRDGVVGPATSAALRSGRRPKPRPGGPARRIEVYRSLGVALLIDGGRTKRAIHVSSGAPGTETPSGRFQVFRKELRSWSVPFQTWLPYASYFNQGIAFHEYPDVPAFPASHGCVRVPAPEAPGVYGFATIGTTVVVI
jgi:hypothetical protein